MKDVQVVSTLNKRAVCVGIASVFIWSVFSSLSVAGQDSDRAANSAAAPGTTVAAGNRQPGEEIETLRKELREKPGDATFIRLGNLLLETGDANGALQAFDDALRLNPRSLEARTGKGAALGHQGKFAEAEEILSGALILNPHPARVHYELGVLYEKRGDFAKAIAEYKEGLKKYQQEKGMFY